MGTVKTIKVKGRKGTYDAIFMLGLTAFDKGVLESCKFLNYLRTQDPEIKIKAVEAIFKIIRYNKDYDYRKNEYLWNPYKNSLTSKNELLRDTSSVKWNCAVCGAPIYAKTNNFRPENFLCNECKTKKHNKLIDRRIVEASKQFTDYCKYVLLREQKKFFNYIKLKTRNKKQE